MEKEKNGRPPKYTDVDEMEKIIEAYFKECDGTYLTNSKGEQIYNKFGDPVVINRKPPTVTGLALALGFNTRLSLINYQGKKDFVNTVTRAKSYIESYAEGRLFDRDGAMGAKFSLSNNFRGWKDHQNEDDKDALAHLDSILKSLGGAMKDEN